MTRRSPTAALLGDPAPGRSAQDRMATTEAAPRRPHALRDRFDWTEKVDLDSPYLPKVATPPPLPTKGTLDIFQKAGVELPVAETKPARTEADYVPAMAPDPNVRPVEAMELKGEVARPPTSLPMLEWLEPETLLVNATYQRDLSDKSRALINRIATSWDWRRMKPIVCSWTERGFEVIDGQHTAIAAASASIAAVPVMIVLAEELEERAAAFIGHNRDRLPISPTQLHHAAVAAGDDKAVLVDEACKAAEINIIRSPFGGYAYKVGDTTAIGALGALVGRQGVPRAVTVLKALVEAELAPVTSHHIKAAEYLLTDPEHACEVDSEALVKAIRITAETSDKDAKLRAAELRAARWQGLAVVWRQAVKKRRKA